MADFTQAVVTNSGAAAEATAAANGWTIQFTRVQVGQGTTLGSTDPKTLTSLLSPVALVAPDPNAPNANLIGINNLVTYQASIRFEVNSAWVTTQFQLAEAGLFARLNNGAEFLYAYAYAGTNGDIITASGSGSPVDNQYTFLIPYSNAPTIAVTLGVYPQVNLHAATHLDNGIDPFPVATSSRTGSVPIGSGTGLNGLVDTSPISFRPILLVINSTRILYVSTTGNNLTAIADDPIHPWLTIQGALDYLTPYFITPGVTVTISVAAGTYTTSIATTVIHPQGGQIQIVGSIGAVHNITALSGQSGASITLNISGTQDIAAGNYVIISGISSSPQNQINGTFLVTGVSSGAVTFTIPNASAPSFGTVNTGTIQAIKTLVSCSVNTGGMSVGQYGLGLLKNIAFRGSGNGVGISSFSSISLNTVAVYGWNGTNGFAIALNGGNNVLSNVFVVQNHYAISSEQSSVLAFNCVSSYNAAYGFQATYGSFINITNPCWAIANGAGVFAGANAQITADGLFSQNNTQGCLCGTGGSFQVTLLGSVVITINTTDLVVLPFGQITRAAGTNLFYTTTSQAINTVTANGVISP